MNKVPNGWIYYIAEILSANIETRRNQSVSPPTCHLAGIQDSSQRLIFFIFYMTDSSITWQANKASTQLTKSVFPTTSTDDQVHFKQDHVSRTVHPIKQKMRLRLLHSHLQTAMYEMCLSSDLFRNWFYLKHLWEIWPCCSVWFERGAIWWCDG